MGVEEGLEAGPVGVGEGVGAAQQREADPEDLGLEDGLDTGRLAALDVAAHLCESR